MVLLHEMFCKFILLSSDPERKYLKTGRCVATSHMVAYVIDSLSYTDSVDTEAYVYVSGPRYGPSVELHSLGNRRCTMSIFGLSFSL